MIRKYKQEDEKKVLEIWLAASIQSHKFVSTEYWQKMVPVIKKYYLPNTDSFVFEDKRQIKAFMSIIDDKHIGALFVGPKFQNNKIGTKLVNFAKKRYPELTLKVFIKNAEAVRFYQKNGFKIIAEQTDDDTKEHELLMSWSLECKSGFKKKHPGDS